MNMLKKLSLAALLALTLVGNNAHAMQNNPNNPSKIARLKEFIHRFTQQQNNQNQQNLQNLHQRYQNGNKAQKEQILKTLMQANPSKWARLKNVLFNNKGKIVLGSSTIILAAVCYYYGFNLMPNIIDVTSNIGETFNQFFNGTLSNIKSFVPSNETNLVKNVTEVIVNNGTNLVKNVTEVIVNNGTNLVNNGTNVIKPVVEKAPEVIKTVVENCKNSPLIYEKILGYFRVC